MKYNKELYNVFSKEEDRLESWMAAVFSKKTDRLINADDIKEILNTSNEFTVVSFEEIDKNSFLRDKSFVEIKTTLQYLPLILNNEDEEETKEKNDKEKKLDTLTYYISLIDSHTIMDNAPNLFSVSDVTKESYDEALKCKYALHVSTVFENFPLEDYQRQLKLISSVVEEASVFFDISSHRLYCGKWLSYTSDFSLPPSLDYLYSIHAVYDDEKHDDKVLYWYHTHGLYRVGSIELEIIGTEDKDAAYGDLLNTAAKMFIERGVPEEGFVFQPSYEVFITWFPCEVAFEKLKLESDILGGLNDRDDGIHNTPSGILVAVDNKKKYHVMDYYKERLTDNPIFYLSNFETSIMRYAAKSKVHIFLKMLKHSKENINKSDADENKISFLVKLGYSEDKNEADENNLEHLWFEVFDFNEDTNMFDAVLLNEPYQKLNMHKGDRGNHSIEKLTDWIIDTAESSFNARNIYMLFSEGDSSNLPL